MSGRPKVKLRRVMIATPEEVAEANQITHDHLLDKDELRTLAVQLGLDLEACRSVIVQIKDEIAAFKPEAYTLKIGTKDKWFKLLCTLIKMVDASTAKIPQL